MTTSHINNRIGAALTLACAASLLTPTAAFADEPTSKFCVAATAMDKANKKIPEDLDEEELPANFRAVVSSAATVFVERIPTVFNNLNDPSIKGIGAKLGKVYVAQYGSLKKSMKAAKSDQAAVVAYGKWQVATFTKFRKVPGMSTAKLESIFTEIDTRCGLSTWTTEELSVSVSTTIELEIPDVTVIG